MDRVLVSVENVPVVHYSGDGHDDRRCVDSFIRVCHQQRHS